MSSNKWAPGTGPSAKTSQNSGIPAASKPLVRKLVALTEVASFARGNEIEQRVGASLRKGNEVIEMFVRARAINALPAESINVRF
jgi:hypothetical protein